jgi:hypothetical protein
MKKDYLFLFILIISSLVGCRKNMDNIIIDGFESNKLSHIWRTDKFIPGALKIQSEIIKSGKSAVKITLQTGQKKTVLYNQTDDIRDMWLSFKFQIRFSRQKIGQIIASMNGQEIINYSGITSYSEEYGYHFPGKFYFKTGLYRDKMDQSMSIYIDDYRKQKLISSAQK